MTPAQRDRIREQIRTSRLAQGLQASVPASRFLADLAAEVLEEDQRKEGAIDPAA